MVEMKTVKLGVSIPEEVLKELETIRKAVGYSSRSKAISDAIQLFIGTYKWQKASGTCAGAIVMLFDHHEGHVEDEVTDVQHEFLDVVSATMHIHLSHRYCLEIVGVKGKVGKIKELHSKLAKIKGIKSVQAIILPLLEEK